MRQMKDSGIEWIGEIPAGKKVVRNKYKIVYVKGKNPSEINSDGLGVPYIGATDLDNCNYKSYTTDVDLPDVRKEDVLILWDGARAGLCGIGKEGKLSSTVVKLSFSNDIYPYFFYWYYLGFSNYISSCVSGTTIPHMYRQYIDDIGFINFSLPEQQRIAAYLDAKCGEIDKVMSKTRESIAEYKKLKQSIITEAVTNPKWEVVKLKYLVTILDEYRKPVAAEERTHNSEVLYDYYGASGQIDKIDGYTIDDHILLIGEDGANLLMRHLPLVYEVNGKAWINNHAHILKPNDGVNFYFVKYALESKDISVFVTGSAQPKLSQDNLKVITLMVPTLSEQQRIVAYLDKKCSEIDNLIARKEQLLTELEKYKKSLIYECVTGKREVG